MLVQLVFASVATDSSAKAVESIFKHGRAYNAGAGVTGVLCYGHGMFLEAIEGERSRVNRIYADVLKDAKHADVELLHFAEIVERDFANWSLGRVNLEKLTPSVILKYTTHLPLRPEQWSGASAIAFFKDLVASASVLAK